MAAALERDDASQVGKQAVELSAAAMPWLRDWGFIPLRAPSDAEGEGDVNDLLVDDRHYRCPDTETLIINAHRVRAARQALLDTGSLSVKELAAGRRSPPNTIRKQIQRACKRNELISVTVSGEVRVPAVLLDEALDVRSVWWPVIAHLRDARLSDWAIWGWIARPNGGLSGQVAAEVIKENPERVYAAAHRRMAQAIS